ncbi:MAG: GNAT family N-acetyltransferase [Alphaproteobacteria bacterium]|nr:MAG: GNAT family N-acetyltransferase [Alphaproteobacteria bacterium]
MTVADLDGVVDVARLSFPDHFESRACFENRLALSPALSFVLAGTDEAVRGYLFAYPWKGQTAPALNTLIEAIPDDADRIYLHDLALHPIVRRGGHTRSIVERLVDQVRADGWARIALVAVNDATTFWQRMGFHAVTSPELSAKLASYGDDARYMVRTL